MSAKIDVHDLTYLSYIRAKEQAPAGYTDDQFMHILLIDHNKMIAIRRALL